MTRIRKALIDWWYGRTVREQRMVAVMVAMTTIFLVWLLILRPVWSWRDAAAVRRANAESDSQVIHAGIRRLAPPRDGGTVGMSPSEVSALVQRSADAAGMIVVLTPEPTGKVDFLASAVTTGVLFTWLVDLRTQYGIDLLELALVENADATLQATGQFKGPD